MTGRGRASMGAIAIVVVALAMAGCSRAPTPSPTPAATPTVVAATPSLAATPTTCPEWNPPKDSDYGLPETPPAIPKKWRDMASASKTVMTVRGLNGQAICVKLGWISEVSDFNLSTDQRYFDFDTVGYESSGHILVDRRASGDHAYVDTGALPTISNDGRYFAAAQVSESSFGSLEGIGVWEVTPAGFVERAKITDLPGGLDDWDVDDWTDGHCVSLSAGRASDAASAEGTSAAEVERKLRPSRFRLVPAGQTWKLEPGKCPG